MSATGGRVIDFSPRHRQAVTYWLQKLEAAEQRNHLTTPQRRSETDSRFFSTGEAHHTRRVQTNRRPRLAVRE